MVNGADRARLAGVIDSWSDEELEILWRFGGFEDAAMMDRPKTDQRRSMLRGAARAGECGVLRSRVRRDLMALAMLRGMTRFARRELARLFASLAPHDWVRAVVALAHRTVAGTSRPPQQHAPVRRMVSQAGHGVLAPVRGSPAERGAA